MAERSLILKGLQRQTDIHLQFLKGWKCETKGHLSILNAWELRSPDCLPRRFLCNLLIYDD